MRLHDYTKKEGETLADEVTWLSREISELLTKHLKPDGTDKLSKLCIKYDDKYILVDALLWAAANVAGSYNASLIESGQISTHAGDKRTMLSVLYAMGNGIEFGKEVFGITNLVDIVSRIKKNR